MLNDGGARVAEMLNAKEMLFVAANSRHGFWKGKGSARGVVERGKALCPPCCRISGIGRRCVRAAAAHDILSGI